MILSHIRLLMVIEVDAFNNAFAMLPLISLECLEITFDIGGAFDHYLVRSPCVPSAAVASSDHIGVVHLFQHLLLELVSTLLMS
jgi:hypothetical protein